MEIIQMQNNSLEITQSSLRYRSDGKFCSFVGTTEDGEIIVEEKSIIT